MSNIRVTYSGLIQFVVGLIIIIAGFVSTLIVTRSLTVEEFGTWRLILGVIVYALAIQPMISFWSTREIARGIESGKTAIISNTMLSSVGIIIYVAIAFLTSEYTDADREALIFACILIPIMFVAGTLNAINYGWKPQAVAYGYLVLEIGKIPLLLITVYWLELGIHGIILSTFIAYVATLIVLSIFAREKLVSKFNIKYLKKWFKLFWLSLYPWMVSLIHTLDILVFSIITGSVVGLAFYGASMIVAKLCMSAGQIAESVYPKLLEGEHSGFITNNITLLSYFIIPLASISIFFAEEILFALNPIYQIAYLVIIFMTIRTFLFTYSMQFARFLTGIEKVDARENQSFTDFIKSKLFSIPTVRLIQYAAYIVTLAVVLFLTLSGSSQIDLIIYWSIIWLIVEIPAFIYFYIAMKKNFKFGFEMKKITKYFLTSILVFGFISMISKQFLELNAEIFVFVPNLLMYIGAGVIGYLIITYFIDSRTKQLFVTVLKEIRSKKVS